MRQELRLLLAAHVFLPRDLAVEARLHFLFEVLAHLGVDLARQDERHVEPLGHLDGDVLALLG